MQRTRCYGGASASVEAAPANAAAHHRNAEGAMASVTDPVDARAPSPSPLNRCRDPPFGSAKDDALAAAYPAQPTRLLHTDPGSNSALAGSVRPQQL